MDEMERRKTESIAHDDPDLEHTAEATHTPQRHSRHDTKHSSSQVGSVCNSSPCPRALPLGVKLLIERVQVQTNKRTRHRPGRARDKKVKEEGRLGVEHGKGDGNGASGARGPQRWPVGGLPARVAAQCVAIPVR